MVKLYTKLSKSIREQRQSMKFGGVVSLKSLWAITRPNDLNFIRGITAEVKAEEIKKGLYYYINLQLENGKCEELRLVGWTNLREGYEIDISSIIVIFFYNGKGETILRYDALENEDKIRRFY